MRQIFSSSSDAEIIDAIAECVRAHPRTDDTDARHILDAVDEWSNRPAPGDEDEIAELKSQVESLESKLAEIREAADAL